jgi:hypothetical protein
MTLKVEIYHGRENRAGSLVETTFFGPYLDFMPLFVLFPFWQVKGQIKSK